MSTLAITEDINYLVTQSSSDINNALAGMTSLLNNNDCKVAAIESQNWFQRMVKTVTGKNKLTQEEIRQNNEKINIYMVEVIKGLFNKNCISIQVMQSLGMQLNEFYAEHLQLKHMLSAFVTKLNQKIESIDNFHMLITEIEQEVYSKDRPIVAICKILSHTGQITLNDERKIGMLERCLREEKIINEQKIPIIHYINDIMGMNDNEIGQIYLELGTIRQNFIADILISTIENYSLLPPTTKKIKDKKAIIKQIAIEKGIQISVELSISDIYDDFMKSKIEAKDRMVAIENNNQNNMLENKEVYYEEEYFDETLKAGGDTEVTAGLSTPISSDIDVYEDDIEYKANLIESANLIGNTLTISREGILEQLTCVEDLIQNYPQEIQDLVNKQLADTKIILTNAGIILEKQEDVIHIMENADIENCILALESLAKYFKANFADYLEEIETQVDGINTDYLDLHFNYKSFAMNNIKWNDKETIKQNLSCTLEIPRGEKVLFYSDTTVFGTGGNGYAATVNGLYYKPFMGKLMYIPKDKFIDDSDIVVYKKDIYIGDTRLGNYFGDDKHYIPELFRELKMFFCINLVTDMIKNCIENISELTDKMFGILEKQGVFYKN